MTVPQEQLPDSTIPDLRDIPLDRLAKLKDSALARSLELYRERLADNNLRFSNFSARI